MPQSHLSSPPDLEKTTTTSQEGGGSADAVVENPVLEGVHLADEKRTNGRSPSADATDLPFDQGLDARDSLGSRASVSETDADLDAVFSDTDAALVEAVDYADFDIPGADENDDVSPFVIESTAEQVAEAEAFFGAAKEKETREQKARARMRSRVVSIMQYRAHPRTGEVMMTQEQIEAGLRTLGPCIHRVAYTWHLFDRLVEVDEGTEQPVCCGLKGPHVHIVIWFTEDRPAIRAVSDAFWVPSARVRPPKEIAAQEGTELHKGRNAAEKAFFDLAEYLTHESRGANAIQGVNQPERYYLVDRAQPGKPGKYQYGRGRVVANFDFSKELDAHMAGRVRAADGGQTLRQRKIKLRRAVMDGMDLVEAREKDRDAYADDLPRLRELSREYAELSGKKIAEQIGPVWRKSFVLAAGPTRQGKDLVLGELGSQLVWMAGLAGCDWRVVKPAGRNSLEGIGRAEVVHHEDMRHKLVPDYDEGLRYFDPNQAVEAATRFRNTAAPTPRAIMASTSETLLSLGVTMKRRASSDHLAELAGDHKTAPKVALDIDEFLFRIGWYLEVSKPDDAGDDVDRIREGMLVSIFRVRESAGEPRIERAYTRGGDWIGNVSTRHELEPVAVIKGCTEAARFLAVSIIQERNQDVAESIPVEQMHELATSHAQIEGDARERAQQREIERMQQELADAERAKRREEAERARRAAEVEEHERMRSVCTCKRFPVSAWDAHEDECPLLSAEEREQRTVEKQRIADERLAEIRKNGLVLDVPESRH